eukprot:scaffold1386_cov119-Isochrysis_galbana.AAC.10
MVCRGTMRCSRAMCTDAVRPCSRTRHRTHLLWGDPLAGDHERERERQPGDETGAGEGRGQLGGGPNVAGPASVSVAARGGNARHAISLCVIQVPEHRVRALQHALPEQNATAVGHQFRPFPPRAVAQRAAERVFPVLALTAVQPVMGGQLEDGA